MQYNPDTASHAEPNFRVRVASALFMIIGTGGIYFLIIALKLVSAEFE
jgi:hypothetical protein